MLTVDVAKKMEVAVRNFELAYLRARAVSPMVPVALHRAYGYLDGLLLAAPEGSERIAAAQRGEKMMAAFASLAPHHRFNIGAADWMRGKGHLSVSEIMRQTAQAEAEAWNAHPALAELHAEMQAAAEGRRQATEAASEAATLAAQAAYPSALVARLRAAGVHLALGADGDSLTVHEGDKLAAHDLAELRHHRAGVIAGLKAEVEAAKPRPVALLTI